ncbi:MAG: uridine kinase [Crocinitomicaceae bacterium]|nr:uridine kinase [Crocinitomicaceae bacterium]
MKIVALTGGSGSGKSTVLNGLREHFSGEVTILSLDDYYRPKNELPKDDQGETNFDVPEVINYDDLLRDMRSLMSGNIVELDTYTYNKSAMSSERIQIKPAPWLILEGIFTLYHKEVREMVDIKAFIDASVATRLERRKHRDHTVRGYAPDEIQYQWDNHVRPSELKFIDPWKSKCDIVIDNENNWKRGLTQLVEMMALVH